MNDLLLNALLVNHKQDNITAYVSDSSMEGAIKVKVKDDDDELKVHAADELMKCVYLTIDDSGKSDGKVTRSTKPTKLDTTDAPCWSIGFMKGYYSRLLFNYFKGKGVVCKYNFTSDIELWIDGVSPYAACSGYNVYGVRVQFNDELKSFEWLISYDSVRSASKLAVTDPKFSNSPKDIFNWVVYEGDLRRYDELTESAQHADMSKAFPVINNRLKTLLNIPIMKPDKGNRYIKYMEKIDWFRKTYLEDEQLTEILNISTTWRRITPKTFPTAGIKDMLFGNGQILHDTPKHKLNPLEKPENDNVEFFFIGHNSDIPLAAEVNKYLSGENHSPTQGVANFLNLHYYTTPKGSIWFSNSENPIDEIAQALEKKLKCQTDESAKRQLIAIYLSPYPKTCANKKQHQLYYDVKELLLSHNIVSQTIEVEKAWPNRKEIKSSNNNNDNDNNNKKKEVNKPLLAEGFQFYFASLLVSIYTKLGGVAWGIEAIESDDLVIGVSAYKSVKRGTNYLGSAFSFHGTGKFQKFNTFESHQLRELVGMIKMTLRDVIANDGSVKRLIIHFYKRLNKVEVEMVMKVLSNLGLEIPVIFITVNKTLSSDVVVFDASKRHLMPPTGLYVPLKDNGYLVYNNQLLHNEEVVENSRYGYPFPLKIKAVKYESNTSIPKALDKEELEGVLTQLCRFSLPYWKSVSPQWMPVTLRYPEMLAEIASSFKYKDWGELGSDRLWFL